MKEHKRDPRWKNKFEGMEVELEKYYNIEGVHTIDDWFGPIEDLKIGEQIESIIGTEIIKRKADKYLCLVLL